LRSKTSDKVSDSRKAGDDVKRFNASQTRLFHYPLNLGLAGKVGNVELARPADRVYNPAGWTNKVFDKPASLGGSLTAAVAWLTSSSVPFSAKSSY